MILRQSTINNIQNKVGKNVYQNTGKHVNDAVDTGTSLINSTVDKLNIVDNSKLGGALKGGIQDMLASPAANELLRISGKLNSISKTTKLDLSCNMIQEEIDALEDTINLDNELMNDLIAKRTGGINGEFNTSVGETAALILNKIKTQIEDTIITSKENIDMFIEAMMGIVHDLLNTEGYDPEVIIFMALEQLMAMLEPILALPGMPSIPIIGDLTDMLQKMIKLAQIANKLGQKDNSNKEEEATGTWEKTKEAATDVTLKAYNWIVDIFNDIKALFLEIWEMLPMLLQFYWVFLLSELIEMIKPVIDYFGLVAGPYIKLLATLPSLVMMIFNFNTVSKRYLWERLKRKFAPLLDAVSGLANPGNADDNEKIKYLYTEILTSELDMGGKQIELDQVKTTIKINKADKLLQKMEKEKADFNDNNTTNAKASKFGSSLVSLGGLLPEPKPAEETEEEKTAKRATIDSMNLAIEGQKQRCENLKTEAESLAKLAKNFKDTRDTEINKTIPKLVADFMNTFEELEKENKKKETELAGKQTAANSEVEGAEAFVENENENKTKNITV